MLRLLHGRRPTQMCPPLRRSFHHRSSGASHSFLPLGQQTGLGCAPSNQPPHTAAVKMRLIKWPSPAASLPWSLPCAGHFITDPRRKPLFPSSRPARWAWVRALQSTAAHCGCPFEFPFKRPFKMRLIKWPSPAASLPWSQGAPVENYERRAHSNPHPLQAHPAPSPRISAWASLFWVSSAWASLFWVCGLQLLTTMVTMVVSLLFVTLDADHPLTTMVGYTLGYAAVLTTL